ncbi:hypothetical protein GGS21DRAFT_502047 [Xylaria nigripes]|nr:hypothetical protein GGS21DRAFT_502047 [Xylaria nigripes]
MGQQADNNARDIIHSTATRKPRAGYQRGPTRLRRENASACVNSCFDELITNVEDACRQLQQPEHQKNYLWDLYCCDSVNCGVYIGSIGQSPNVDLIINECQNIGFFSIEDPGPPATNYCRSSMPNTISSLSVTVVVEPSEVPVSGTLSVESAEPSTVPPIHSSDVAVLLTPTSVLSSNPIKTGSSATNEDTNPSRLSGGAKAAIGVLSVLGALAIAALVFLLFRRQRKRPRNNHSRPSQVIPYGGRPYHSPNSGSRTPLITPPSSGSRGIRLAPPAKLSDRMYLQPIFKQGTTRPLALSGIGSQTFSSPPICNSSKKQPKPPHEGRAANSIRLPVAIRVTEPSHHPQSSAHSLSSARGASNPTVESNKTSSTHSGSATITGTSTPPLSPTRVHRALDGSHESSDFMTPAGPPPTRALPAPPIQSPNSPTFSVFSGSSQSPTFPARSLIRGESHVVHIQKNTDPIPPISASTQELLDLTEAYERETRESWGSWSGVGGGGPGVSLVDRKRKSKSPRGSGERRGGTKTKVMLQDLDLERLCGRY